VKGGLPNASFDGTSQIKGRFSGSARDQMGGGTVFSGIHIFLRNRGLRIVN
jgi:hypothetical protein